MKQEEKDLLLEDLCARLPYKVYAQIPDEYGGYTSAIESIDIDGFVTDFEGAQIEIENVKPYLFPMSSMTKEQREEFDTKTFELLFGEVVCNKKDEMEYGKLMAFELDFYHKHHLDWRGLIPKGLALDATNLNIY